MKWKVPITKISKSTITVEVEAEEPIFAERAAVDLAKTLEFPMGTELFEPGIALSEKNND